MALAIENFAKMQGPNKVLLLGGTDGDGSRKLEGTCCYHCPYIKNGNWNEVVLVGGDYSKN
jgi:hypothetical protein